MGERPLMVVLENVLQALTAGLLIGSIYGLMCVGLGLIFGVMRVINFAQGEFLMLGMYATLYGVTWGGLSPKFGPYVGPVVGAVAGGVLVYVAGGGPAPAGLARGTGHHLAPAAGAGAQP